MVVRIRTPTRDEEIDYSKMGFDELQERIDVYERKYSMNYHEFSNAFDCGYAEREERTDDFIWGAFVRERRENTVWGS